MATVWRWIRSAAVYGILISWLAAVIVPLLWVCANSLRSSREIVENPFGIPWLIAGAPESAGDVDPWESARANYEAAWVESGFSAYFVNSILATGVSLAGILAVGVMAAYALARYDFRGNRLLFLFFISGMMVPPQLVIVPMFFQFATWSEWGSYVLAPFCVIFTLHDSLTGLILLYIALSLPFTILVLTGFLRSLPRELHEAAIIDGCGEYRAFWLVMLPLAKPGLVTAAIFNFIGLWNEYLFALVFITSEAKKTLPLGLAGVSIQAQYRTDFGLMFAGFVIVLVPTLLVYLMLQRRLTRGITVGALKG